MRSTDIACVERRLRTSPTSPVTGAALAGSGVHASGRCPSPASRPEVGSRPIQPAPGRYTSHHACRSVKSRSGPGRAFERRHVGLQLNQVARDEARGEAEMTKKLHEQPRRVAARAGPTRQRLLRRLHAGIETNDVADVAFQLLVDVDQGVDGPPPVRFTPARYSANRGVIGSVPRNGCSSWSCQGS